ncbi:MAG: hypothetical protein ACPG05_01785, partial [Bdellovibrionales bacterium]
YHKRPINFLSGTAFFLTMTFMASSSALDTEDDSLAQENAKAIDTVQTPPDVVPQYREWSEHHRNWKELGGYFNAIQSAEHKSDTIKEIYSHERLFRLSRDLRRFWRITSVENRDVEERCIPVYEAHRTDMLRQHGANIALTNYQENSVLFIDAMRKSSIGKDLVNDAIVNDRWICAVEVEGARYLSDGKEVNVHKGGTFYYSQNTSVYATSFVNDCKRRDHTHKIGLDTELFTKMLFTQLHEFGHAAQDARLKMFQGIDNEYYLEDRVFFYASAETQQMVIDALVRAEFILSGQKDLVEKELAENKLHGNSYARMVNMILDIGMEEIKQDISLLEPVYMEALRSNYTQMMIVYHWSSQLSHKQRELEFWAKYPETYGDEKELPLPWEEYAEMYGRLPLTGFNGNIFSNYEGGLENLMRQVPVDTSVGRIWHQVLDVRGDGRSTEFEFGADRDHDKAILSVDDPLPCDLKP